MTTAIHQAFACSCGLCAGRLPENRPGVPGGTRMDGVQPASVRLVPRFVHEASLYGGSNEPCSPESI